jgi:hypothetical protein
MLEPLATVTPLNVHEAPVAIVQVEFVYVPLKTPLLHNRISFTHDEPYGTDGTW